MRLGLLSLAAALLLAAGFLTACGESEGQRRIDIGPMTITISHTTNGSTATDTYTIRTIVLPG